MDDIIEYPESSCKHCGWLEEVDETGTYYCPNPECPNNTAEWDRDW